MCVRACICVCLNREWFKQIRSKAKEKDFTGTVKITEIELTSFFQSHKKKGKILETFCFHKKLNSFHLKSALSYKLSKCIF